jgi:hypothetical protein
MAPASNAVGSMPSAFQYFRLSATGQYYLKTLLECSGYCVQVATHDVLWCGTIWHHQYCYMSSFTMFIPTLTNHYNFMLQTMCMDAKRCSIGVVSVVSHKQ